MSALLPVFAVVGSALLMACARHADPWCATVVEVKPHGAPQRYSVPARTPASAQSGTPRPFADAPRSEMTRQQCAQEAQRLGKSIALWCAGL
jgi:hypothetical protein